MINITIKSIPHREQSYETPGDYWEENQGQEVQIRVSSLPDWRYEVLIAVHELVEYYLCKYQQISETAIRAFDEEFERQRALGVYDKNAEPGDQPDAPYRSAHFWATTIERTLGALLGVDWKEYEQAVTDLLPKGKTNAG